MSSALIFLSCIAIAYLVGSISSAILVSKTFGLPDPRSEGSQNPGATNVLRLAGKKYAIFVLVADMLKGLLPVLLAKLIGADSTTQAFAAFAAVFGHMYPVFFGFKGGKGVATALGAFLALNFMFGIIVVAIWLVVANFSHYSSLASLISILFAPFASLFAIGNMNAFLPLCLIALFVLYKHRQNITRLVDGTESKISFRSKKAKHQKPE